MYLFFDTETSGLPKSWKAPVADLANWPRLVELAWLLYDGGDSCIDSGNAIVRPEEFSIPAEATAVHGITTTRARAEGAPLEAVLEEFTRSIGASRLLIAHNISFDEKIVAAELLRTGVTSRFHELERFCTMKASTELCALPGRYGFKWPTLPELHQELFGSTPKGAHAAASDVQACANCFFELKRRGFVQSAAT
jgi:DNA polymerase-3 subunit epsilon